MRITRKFKNLTKFTYVHGEEHLLEPHLPKGYTKDEFGNYFLQIGDNPTTMFTCHLDTAAWKNERVRHVFQGKYIKTDGTTILGADDKAGMVVILYMIENKIPGLYYFFVGEESGCIGSGALSKVWKDKSHSSNIKKCISFDRRGTTSVITQQLYGVCCSDEFAVSLSEKLNSTGFGFDYKPDPTGIFTDSAKFMSLIPECTNISVGYYSEHTQHESQDIDFLQKLCKAVVKVDWESLPIIRDPENDDWSDLDEDEDDDWFDEDDDFETDSDFSHKYFSYFKCKDGVKKMYISNSHIQKETKEIERWLRSEGTYANCDNIIWNGHTLKVDIDSRIETLGSRIEMIEFIPYLGEVPTKELSFKVKKQKTKRPRIITL